MAGKAQRAVAAFLTAAGSLTVTTAGKENRMWLRGKASTRRTTRLSRSLTALQSVGRTTACRSVPLGLALAVACAAPMEVATSAKERATASHQSVMIFVRALMIFVRAFMRFVLP